MTAFSLEHDYSLGVLWVCHVSLSSQHNSRKLLWLPWYHPTDLASASTIHSFWYLCGFVALTVAVRCPHSCLLTLPPQTGQEEKMRWKQVFGQPKGRDTYQLLSWEKHTWAKLISLIACSNMYQWRYKIWKGKNLKTPSSFPSSQAHFWLVSPSHCTQGFALWLMVSP